MGGDEENGENGENEGMSCELATYLLCLVPEKWISHELLWTSGEIKFEGEAKDSIHVSQEIQTATNFTRNL